MFSRFTRCTIVDHNFGLVLIADICSNGRDLDALENFANLHGHDIAMGRFFDRSIGLRNNHLSQQACAIAETHED